MKQASQDDVQSLLTRAMKSPDMQALLNHPNFPGQDKDVIAAMDTIATKLAAGPGYVGMGGYGGAGDRARLNYTDELVGGLVGGATPSAEAPAARDENVQRAMGAIDLLRQQEEYEKAKKEAALEAKKPTALGLILEMADKQLLKPAAKNLGEMSDQLKQVISGPEDPMSNFRLTPPAKKSK